jgi:glycosyltransferase involved in cell wall biosynthesis
MRKKNVLLFIAGLQRGGAEKVIAALSIDLSKKYTVFVALFNTSYGIDYPYSGHLLNLNAPGSKNSAFNSIFYRVYRFLVLSLRLKKVKKKHAIDVSISFLDNANMVNLFSRNKEKTIISVRSFTSTYHASRGFYGKIYSALTRLFFSRATTVVVPSSGIYDDLVKTYSIDPKTLTIINNSFELETIRKLSEEPLTLYTKTFDHPVLIQTGRITEAKGQWHLIRIFAELKKNMPTLKLVILGGYGDEDEPLKDYILKLTDDYHLTKYVAWETGGNLQDPDVLFLGHQKNPFQFLARATLFCFTSLFEGFPNALVEAMAAGLPVLSADCMSGPREILAPDTIYGAPISTAEYTNFGVLLPVLDTILHPATAPLTSQEAIWVHVIKEFLNDETLRIKYKNKSVERAADFDSKNISPQWENLIDY